MAKITEITYEVASTVKVREYEYAKPRISVTIALEDGDDEESIFKDLTETVRKELKQEIKQLGKIL